MTSDEVETLQSCSPAGSVWSNIGDVLLCRPLLKVNVVNRKHVRESNQRNNTCLLCQ
jgi:hypothetical protein